MKLWIVQACKDTLDPVVKAFMHDMEIVDCETMDCARIHETPV